MAWDLVRGTSDGKDWSLGAALTPPPPGVPEARPVRKKFALAAGLTALGGAFALFAFGRAGRSVRKAGR
jgi:hypothetical protein